MDDFLVSSTYTPGAAARKVKAVERTANQAVAAYQTINLSGAFRGQKIAKNQFIENLSIAFG